jgi:hypothetical protein
MDLGDVLGLVQRVAGVPADADRSSLLAAVGELRRVRSWVESEEIRLASYVVGVSSFPEKAIADAGRGSLRDASQVLERVSTVGVLPGLGSALSAGLITGEHVDAVASRLCRLEPEVRERLLVDAVGLASGASGRSPERYAAFVRERVRLAERADGSDRLEAQRRKVGLSWRPAPDGMHEWRLLLDPVAALSFDRQIAGQVEALFHTTVPEGCPTNPLERQGFLRAHALLSLLRGGGGRMGRPEVIVVVDTRDVPGAAPGEPAGPVVDWGLPVEVPTRVLIDLFGRADVHAVVVRNGVVLHAGGELNLGRSTRLANRAQRRVLRGLYPNCAVPRCSARFDHTSIHHVKWWRHGGFTDLDNLLPLCWKHHQLVHKGGWLLALQPDRTLTVTLPDGTVMATGPPVRSAA